MIEKVPAVLNKNTEHKPESSSILLKQKYVSFSALSTFMSWKFRLPKGQWEWLVRAMSGCNQIFAIMDLMMIMGNVKLLLLNNFA